MFFTPRKRKLTHGMDYPPKKMAAIFEAGVLHFFNHHLVTSWWLSHPFEKYDRQNGFTFPNFRDENKTYLKPTFLSFFLSMLDFGGVNFMEDGS